MARLFNHQDKSVTLIFSLKSKFMKKIILGLGLLCMGTGVFANDVPRKVKEGFARDYPHASVTHWEMVSGKWNAEFRSHGNAVTACYSEQGHRINTRMPVAQINVPDKVIHKLRDKYPGERVHTFTKIDRPNMLDLYKVQMTQHGTDKIIYMDRYGHERDYASR